MMTCTSLVNTFRPWNVIFRSACIISVIEKRFRRKVLNLRINHQVNRMWRPGGSIRNPIAVKPVFLYEDGHPEQSGMVMKEKNLINPYSGKNLLNRAIVKGRITLSGLS